MFDDSKKKLVGTTVTVGSASKQDMNSPLIVKRLIRRKSVHSPAKPVPVFNLNNESTIHTTNDLESNTSDTFENGNEGLTPAPLDEVTGEANRVKSDDNDSSKTMEQNRTSARKKRHSNEEGKIIIGRKRSSTDKLIGEIKSIFSKKGNNIDSSTFDSKPAVNAREQDAPLTASSKSADVWLCIERLRANIEKKEEELEELRQELKIQEELYENLKMKEGNGTDAVTAAEVSKLPKIKVIRSQAIVQSMAPYFVQLKSQDISSERDIEFINALYDPKDQNRIISSKFIPHEDTLFTYYDICHETCSLAPLLKQEYHKVYNNSVVDAKQPIIEDSVNDQDKELMQKIKQNFGEAGNVEWYEEGDCENSTEETEEEPGIDAENELKNEKEDETPTVDIIYDENGDIKAANLPRLVLELTNHQSFDNEFLHLFLLTYRSFTTPYELLSQLIARYNIAPPFIEAQAAKLPPDVQDFYHIPIQYPEDYLELKNFIQNILTPTRLRICQVVKTWLQNHFSDFRADSKLEQQLQDFFTMLSYTHMNNLAKQLKQLYTSQCGRRDTFAKQKFQELLKRNNLEEQVSKKQNGFEHAIESLHTYKKVVSQDKLQEQPLYKFKAGLLARELTYLTFDIFRSILPREFFNQNWTKPNRHKVSPNIMKMIKRSNEIATWVATEVLSASEVELRAKIIKKFIKVSIKLDKLNNFNTLIDIISGLNSNPIHRLSKSWALVPEKYTEELKRLTELTSPQKSYHNLRVAVKERGPPCIPPLGMYLTDITFIEDGNSNKINGLVNFGKSRLLGSVIRDLQTLQNSPFVLKKQPSLVVRSRLTHLPYQEMQELYEISQVFEPKKTTVKKINFD
jgi:hypothetical protein